MSLSSKSASDLEFYANTYDFLKKPCRRIALSYFMSQAQSCCVRLASGPTLNFYAFESSSNALMMAGLQTDSDLEREFITECYKELQACWARRTLATSFKPRSGFVPSSAQFFYGEWQCMQK